MIEAKIRLKSNILHFFILIIILLTSEMALGVPANPAPFNITQPDNSSFQARQVGDEVASHFETLDGAHRRKQE